MERRSVLPPWFFRLTTGRNQRPAYPRITKRFSAEYSQARSLLGFLGHNRVFLVVVLSFHIRRSHTNRAYHHQETSSSCASRLAECACCCSLSCRVSYYNKALLGIIAVFHAATDMLTRDTSDLISCTGSLCSRPKNGSSSTHGRRRKTQSMELSTRNRIDYQCTTETSIDLLVRLSIGNDIRYGSCAFLFLSRATRMVMRRSFVAYILFEALSIVT